MSASSFPASAEVSRGRDLDNSVVSFPALTSPGPVLATSPVGNSAKIPQEPRQHWQGQSSPGLGYMSASGLGLSSCIWAELSGLGAGSGLGMLQASRCCSTLSVCGQHRAGQLSGLSCGLACPAASSRLAAPTHVDRVVKSDC